MRGGGGTSSIKAFGPFCGHNSSYEYSKCSRRAPEYAVVVYTAWGEVEAVAWVYLKRQCR